MAKVLCIGEKYIKACNLTRATFQKYSDSLRKQELTGFSDYEEWQAHKKKHQGVSLARRLAAESHLSSPYPQRLATAAGSGEGTRSTSPAGPASAPPQAKKMPASKADPSANTEFFKLSDAASSKASDGARERWSVSDDSALGAPDDEGAMEELRTKMDAARVISQRSAPSSVVSACSSGTVGDEWSLVKPAQRQKRKGASNASQTSKMSRTSVASINRAGAFFRRPPPP